MRHSPLLPILAVCFFLAFPLAGTQAQTRPAPDKVTAFTLGVLFKLLPLPLAPNSSCARLFPQANHHPTIGGMLADELALFGNGINRITSSCDDQNPRTCSVSFQHGSSAGWSAADISFKIIDGKIPSNSLSCSTPR